MQVRATNFKNDEEHNIYYCGFYSAYIEEKRVISESWCFQPVKLGDCVMA